ncbi:DsbA family protein [Roseinatronobacter alkalisoli]|uniref:DsbA family protein n=1 Tax=Roseinatronobacter alkalisoli TaxID=3028235 RepID=A0ABT5T7P0_9RHOB|nr:DsbA family protein [Roseinatronobacter sp. HJB301]MDD7971145.1 DsbA family protein [Roseinatronobacter sp. HJB301]
MTLPVTDTALIATCMAAAALGVVVLSGAGGSAPVDIPADEQTVQETTQDTPGAQPLSDTVAVDAEFGEKVRSYLLQNPEVIFEAVAEYEMRNTASQADMDLALIDANYDKIFNDGYSWVGGNPDGDLTLVEFMDYQCGFCKRAYPEVTSFLEQDGNVRLIIKEFPILGPESELASRFAIAVKQLAGDDAYGEVHSALIQYEGRYTPELLTSLAEDMGLDGNDVLAMLDDDSITEILSENRMLAQRLQISGTPSFIMETEFLRGFVPADTLAMVAETLRD